jgi:DNA-damage-inducible protein J
MASVTISVDDDVKKDVESLLGKMGYSMSSAINIFFRQVIREQAMPFEVKAKSDYDEYFNEYNMNILEESIAQLKAGEVVRFTMEELKAMEDE